ncbi:TetR/AcrR family transcriptional regulator [Kitasatospora sp. CB02891]|uniref:TetR/AcrR family transcriptional regulator n=1 Tax=Kitasatospora sp. CB02891 TaxID=2020329 RepID=UPI000C27DCA5|nr:TetR/AcrR family transcriptional regulator [Kitasatospora sp. CB02891]PJN27843.1 TetR family transcriptional regulator [Kitasatospora sp. CB02891]
MNADAAPDPRERILAAAAELLAQGGSEAMSTRAVGAAAGVQAPTLYRLFGDKQGLIDAVVNYGFERYLAEKTSRTPGPDPVDDLRRGWDLHVEFGLTHPSFYPLMYSSDRSGEAAEAAERSGRVLATMLERVARAGRLLVPVPTAARMIRATALGVTLTLIAEPPATRDVALSTRMRETVLAAITGAPAAEVSTPAALAIALDATLPERPHRFTAAETALLREWLRRLTDVSPES